MTYSTHGAPQQSDGRISSPASSPYWPDGRHGLRHEHLDAQPAATLGLTGAAITSQHQPRPDESELILTTTVTRAGHVARKTDVLPE